MLYSSIKWFYLSIILMTGSMAALQLSPLPLIMPQDIPPNIMFLFDDSGSMDMEVVTEPYWRFDAYNTLLRPEFWQTNGEFWVNGKQYHYVYDNVDNIYRPLNDSCSQEVCTRQDWRLQNPATNRLYYDPSVVYKPWTALCGQTSCPTARFEQALSNPVNLNLRRNLGGTSLQAEYHVWLDSHGFQDPSNRRRVARNGANQIVDWWDQHLQVILTDTLINGSSSVVAKLKWLEADRTLRSLTLSGNACFNVLGSTEWVINTWKNSASPNWEETNGPNCRTIAQARENFANWYQYYRKRSLAAKASLARILSEYPKFNYGLASLNQNFFVPISPNMTPKAQQEQVLNTLLNYPWQSSPTWLRSGLEQVGRYFRNDFPSTPSPIQYPCQKNFVIVLTDGYWNTTRQVNQQTITERLAIAYGDTDGDGKPNTVADIAYYFFKNDLRPDLANLVPQTNSRELLHQSLSTYIIGFGVKTNLNAGPDGWPSPPLGIQSNWGNPWSDANPLDRINDLWHAAFNTNGQFLSANSPDILLKSLRRMLNSIASISASSASLGQTDYLFNNSTRIFQTKFNSYGWRGSLLAYTIATLGKAPPLWDAGCILTGGLCEWPVLAGNAPPAPQRRIMITKRTNGPGIPFQAVLSTAQPTRSELSTEQIAALCTGQLPGGCTAYQQNLIAYLRGNRSMEQQNGGEWRTRLSLLGDIINSAPTYVGAPAQAYPLKTAQAAAAQYTAFRQQFLARSEVVYVNANDGMMHGFDAITGEEKLAYVPGFKELYAKLPGLAQPDYAHQYFVDGLINTTEVFLPMGWRTILVSSLGLGGAGVFCLDITDPASFSESNASALVLWELGPQDDPDLGSSLGQVQFAVLSNGEPAAIFSNGYNSSREKAVLFVIFLNQIPGVGERWQEGLHYAKLTAVSSVRADNNGLSPVFLVDTNQDGVTEYAYAGDLHGNLWRFDLRSTRPSEWKVRLIAQLFNQQRGDQSITSQPTVSYHPNGLAQGLMVYVGTGKYLETSDIQNISTQAMYGIWDNLSDLLSPRQPTQLLKQSILEQKKLTVPQNSIDKVRLISNLAINWQTHFGWVLPLSNADSPGERIILSPLVRNNILSVSSLVPAVSACSPGGSGWIMTLNPANGGGLNTAVFDLNQDGQYNAADYMVDKDGNTVAPSGLHSSVGVLNQPTVLYDPTSNSIVNIINASQGIIQLKEQTKNPVNTRRNWRPIYL